MTSPQIPNSVHGAPSNCAECDAPLCIRKQTLNLALGNTETMLCLVCLANNEDAKPEQLLAGTMGYIMGRECFRKEWQRYKTVADCPEPKTCFPDVCFNGKKNG